MYRTLAFCLPMMLLSAPLWAGEDADDGDDAERAIVWGDDVKKDDGVLGDLMPGSKLRYTIQTQLANLEASDVKITLFWLDTAKQQEASQVLIERTHSARMEEYSLKWVPAESMLYLSYNCPTRRGDSETICTERWLWKGGARRFKYTKTTTNNPLADSQDAVVQLIQSGKLDRATASIKAMREKYGEDRVAGDAFFVAYFDEMSARALAMADRGQGAKAVALIEGFIAKPPITSSERCPNKTSVLICMAPDRPDCGCNDPFGLLPATDRYANRLERIGKLLNKEGKHAVTLRLLRPALTFFDDRPRYLLTLADAAWASDDKDKAREWYKAYMKLSVAAKQTPYVRAVQRAEEPKPQ